jgi:hypothetical protein
MSTSHNSPSSLSFENAIACRGIPVSPDAAAISVPPRLGRELLPPDSVTTAEVRRSEARHGRGYQRKTKVDIVLDLNSIDFAKLI